MHTLSHTLLLLVVSGRHLESLEHSVERMKVSKTGESVLGSLWLLAGDLGFALLLEASLGLH